MTKHILSLHRILNHRPLAPVVKPVRFGTELKTTQHEYRQALWGKR